MNKPLAVRIDQLQSLKCKCRSEEFTQVFFLKRVPALLIGTPQDDAMPVPAWKCNRCGKILDLQNALMMAAADAIIESRKSQ